RSCCRAVSSFVGTVGIPFETIGVRLVGIARVTYGQAKLEVTGETVIDVKAIIPCTEYYKVFTVHRTAEPLNTVITTVGHLDIFKFGSAAYTTQCDTVGLIVGGQLDTCKFHAYVL